MRNTLIVFSGKAQSGKTTCSQLFRDYVHYRDLAEKSVDTDKYPYLNTPGAMRVQIHSFATALKDIAKKYFNWDGDKGIYYQTFTKDTGALTLTAGGVTYTPDTVQMPVADRGRTLLLNIGKKFREIRPSIWLDYVINNIKSIDKDTHNTIPDTFFVIDDMRFKNELIEAKTFHTCYSVRVSRTEGALDLDDISERDLDNAEFDFYIDNNGSREDLTNKLAELYNKIEARNGN